VKIKYESHKFKKSNLDQIAIVNEIIELYLPKNLILTLRQLFYQLVIRNVIVNSEKAYRNLGNTVKKARNAGLTDWDGIEDRGRLPHYQTQFKNAQALINAAIRQYRLPRWAGQDWYCELWTEKDALSNILAVMAKQYHITMMVDKGFGSTSSLHDAADRFIAHKDAKHKAILYLGDFDPSGEDMVRDLRRRMKFYGANVEVRKIALTFDQVKQYNLVPNPVKKKDSRSRSFIEKYGESSWEVDALPPDVLHQLVEDAILKVLDMDKYNEVIEREDADKELLEEMKDKFNTDNPDGDDADDDDDSDEADGEDGEDS
jgi:hypothetical protein